MSAPRPLADSARAKAGQELCLRQSGSCTLRVYYRPGAMAPTTRGQDHDPAGTPRRQRHYYRGPHRQAAVRRTGRRWRSRFLRGRQQRLLGSMDRAFCPWPSGAAVAFATRPLAGADRGFPGRPGPGCRSHSPEGGPYGPAYPGCDSPAGLTHDGTLPASPSHLAVLGSPPSRRIRGRRIAIYGGHGPPGGD